MGIINVASSTVTQRSLAEICRGSSETFVKFNQTTSQTIQYCSTTQLGLGV